MGSFWDGGCETGPMKTKPVVDCGRTTPPFDSPPPLSDEKTEGGGAEYLLQDTEPLDITVPDEDAFDTQLLCLAGETQALDLDGETQALDDFDCIDEMETQLIDLDDRVVSDSEGEETDTTQVLDVNEDVSDDICGNERGVLQQATPSVDKQHDAGLHASTTTPVVEESPELKPGSVRLHFTSVRVASLRASGLAARTKSGSRSVPSNNHSTEQFVVEDNGVAPLRGLTTGEEEENREYDLESDGDRVKSSRVGSSTVRKLFTEDSYAENKAHPHNSVSDEEGGDVHELPCDLAGLSYVDSQEPGELSQANALDFVDKFLQHNVEEFDTEGDCRKSSRKNSNLVSSAKGPQTLAKKASDKSILPQASIFEWDDSREDEGGGEFFCRKRSDFFVGGFHGSKSLPQVRNSKKNRPDGQKDHEEELQFKKKKIGILQSDCKLLVRYSKVNEKTESKDEMKHRKNLTSEFDKQFNIYSTREKLDVYVNKTQVPEMLNVGPDTQMAAEAMEALFNGEAIHNSGADNTRPSIQSNSPRGSVGEKRKTRSCSKKPPSRKRAHSSDAVADSSRGKKTRTDLNSKCSSISSLEYANNSRYLPETEMVTKSKKAGSRAGNRSNSNRSKISEKGLSVSVDLRTEGSKKKNLPGDVGTFTPIACRTRQSMTGKVGEVRNIRPNKNEHPEVNIDAISNGIKLDGLSFPKRRRSLRNLARKVSGPDNLDDPSEPSFVPDKFGKCVTRDKRLQAKAKGSSVNKELRRETPSSAQGSRLSRNLEGNFVQQCMDKEGFGDAELLCNSSGKNGKLTSVDIPDGSSDANPSSIRMTDESPRQKCKPSNSACVTPVSNSKVAVNEASPVCMGNEYFKQSCKRSTTSLFKEICGLSPHVPEPTSASKDLRKRRDMTDVRVLYSHHLDEDITKQQKKVLARLGVSIASSMTDATHFIADQFVRTRNMLEAIASGKPVVTHLWLESCGQANCFIDEKNYILRDSKKEKEFGFSMPASLARACQHPLLEDCKVFITPNTKPGKEIISSLVKAVNGQAVERIGRSALKDDQILNNLLILSCEEDYDMCVPFLEKGAAIYSSELVLNGIVTQKLEYERHRLFTDYVRKTRSTIWVRKDGNKFHHVTKNK